MISLGRSLILLFAEVALGDEHAQVRPINLRAELSSGLKLHLEFRRYLQDPFLETIHFVQQGPYPRPAGRTFTRGSFNSLPWGFGHRWDTSTFSIGRLRKLSNFWPHKRLGLCLP